MLGMQGAEGSRNINPSDVKAEGLSEKGEFFAATEGSTMSSEALLCSIPEALERVSVGRSFLYERLADGSIRSVKAGKRRLVDVASLTTWAANLPESQLKQVSKR
jgi:excisionase family DNA binding protein